MNIINIYDRRMSRSSATRQLPLCNITRIHGCENASRQSSTQQPSFFASRASETSETSDSGLTAPHPAEGGSAAGTGARNGSLSCKNHTHERQNTPRLDPGPGHNNPWRPRQLTHARVRGKQRGACGARGARGKQRALARARDAHARGAMTCYTGLC